MGSVGLRDIDMLLSGAYTRCLAAQVGHAEHLRAHFAKQIGYIISFWC